MRTTAIVRAVRTLSTTDVPAVRGLMRGRLTVGAEPCLGSVDLPAELARFRTANQGVEIRLRQLGSVELIEGVASGSVIVRNAKNRVAPSTNAASSSSSALAFASAPGPFWLGGWEEFEESRST